MNYFDLHCDTVIEAYSGKLNTQITPKKAAGFENYSQIFAIWMNDSISPGDAFLKAKAVADYYFEYIKAFKNAHFRPFLALENGISLGDDLQSVEYWKSKGVCAVTLTWNGANSLGFGSSFQGGAGLTQFGREAFKELQNAGILVDVSHLNERGFYDCIELAKSPLIATHSNCFSLCPHRRNLKDEQIKELFALGGVMGICFYPEFLGKGDTFELIYEHIYHALELGGENRICFGSDFDGAKMSKELDSLEKAESLYTFLSKKGFDDELLAKIFYKNGENFFNNVLHK